MDLTLECLDRTLHCSNMCAAQPAGNQPAIKLQASAVPHSDLNTASDGLDSGLGWVLPCSTDKTGKWQNCVLNTHTSSSIRPSSLPYSGQTNQLTWNSLAILINHPKKSFLFEIFNANDKLFSTPHRVSIVDGPMHDWEPGRYCWLTLSSSISQQLPPGRSAKSKTTFLDHQL